MTATKAATDLQDDELDAVAAGVTWKIRIGTSPDENGFSIQSGGSPNV